jgi:tetratricopeptide (TPR) repeat protein
MWFRVGNAISADPAYPVGVRSFNALEVTTVKAPYRSALSAAVIAAALVVSAIPAVASAQRAGQGPGPDTKRVLVTAFRGDAEGGVRTADETRGRVASEFNIRTLMPTSKKDIDNTLIQSGYKPDSALSPNDIKELARLVRADEVIDGTVTKTPTGYRINARFFLPRDVFLTQPLLSADNANLGDVAKQIVSEYDQARKQLQANQECENNIRDRKIDLAIASARKGIAAYPKATIARLCLASAFQTWKTTADSTKPWADSVLKVTNEVIALDQRSKIAYTLAYDAYKAKNDADNSLKALVGMMNADPTNTTLREQVIKELVESGKADIAVPTARQLKTDNTGDPQYARLYWLVLRAAKNYKESIPAGEDFVKLDTAAADSGYYVRQAFDAGADSNYTKAIEFSSLGSAKFPKNATLLVIRAQNERKAGQVPAAKLSIEKALAIDPKVQGGTQLAIQINNDLGLVDDAVKVAKADTENKDRDAAFLLSLGQGAYKAGVASKKPEDFKKAVVLLKGSDEISPSNNAKFLLGVAGFSLVQYYGTTLQATKTCADAKEGQDAALIVNTYLPPSASVNPEAAKQIMTAMPQYSTFFDASAKKYCK